MADATKIGRIAIAASGTAPEFGQAGGRNSFPRGRMDRPPGLADAKTWLRNIPGSKSVSPSEINKFVRSIRLNFVHILLHISAKYATNGWRFTAECERMR